MESKLSELIPLRDDVMCNLDRSINYTIAEKLKDGKHFAQYSAWNFCGWVYWDTVKQLFVCEVWVFHSLREIFEYRSLELIMSNVCREYGVE